MSARPVRPLPSANGWIVSDWGAEKFRQVLHELRRRRDELRRAGIEVRAADPVLSIAHDPPELWARGAGHQHAMHREYVVWRHKLCGGNLIDRHAQHSPRVELAGSSASTARATRTESRGGTSQPSSPRIDALTLSNINW